MRFATVLALQWYSLFLRLSLVTLCHFWPTSICHVTIHVYLSARHITQIASGHANRLLSSFSRPDYILLDIRRSLPQCKEPKCLPITPDILQSLFTIWSCPPVTCDRVISRAACCIGFLASCARGSLLTPISCNLQSRVVSFRRQGGLTL